MFVKNPNLGADPNLGDFTVMVIASYLCFNKFHKKLFLYKLEKVDISCCCLYLFNCWLILIISLDSFIFSKKID